MDKTYTAVEQIVATIKLGIEKGTFKLGAKLPTQRGLAEMFGVSRIVIREAIKVLEGQDILISRQGSGIYVKRTDVSRSAGKSSHEKATYTLSEIIELCEAVWEYVPKKLVASASDEVLQMLLERTCNLLENFSHATEQQKFIYESSFGIELSKATGNTMIYNLMMELLKATATIDSIIASSDRYREILGIDKRMLEALLERDAERACLWGKERDRELAKIFRQHAEALEETYKIYISYY